MDCLKTTVDKQKRDLDSMRKEIREKEMLCSALRVSWVLVLCISLSVCTDSYYAISGLSTKSYHLG